MPWTRRRALYALAALPALVPRLADAQPTSTTPASAPTPTPVPLPFDPKKLKGLSEKLITSHWENNYGGALKNLVKVRAELARLTKDSAPFLVAGLRERELTFANSVALHELYFGALGGDGKRGPMDKALSDAFGSAAAWEEQFRATGLSLAGGSGWALLSFDLHAGQVVTSWAGNHTQALASAVPLLVMDLYEHAYALDYGAGAARYVDAFFQNLDWEVVSRRLDRARAAHATLRATLPR